MWWKSAVNFAFFCCLAASGTRSSACDTPVLSPMRALIGHVPLGPCPWLHRLRGIGFGHRSVVRRLRSYYGRVSLLTVVHHRLRQVPPRYGPHNASGGTGGRRVRSPGSHTRSAQARVSDHAGSSERSRLTRPFVLPSVFGTTSASGINLYRGSMAGLCSPLSTLRRDPRGQLRMTRGRCGSLLLHRGGLAPPTSCRPPGAPENGLGRCCR